MRDIKTAVGTACQIAFEYEGWGQEHVSEIYDTFEKPPCSYDELYDLTCEVASLKEEGRTYQESYDILVKKCRRRQSKDA